jgi:hypothetical protein
MFITHTLWQQPQVKDKSILIMHPQQCIRRVLIIPVQHNKSACLDYAHMNRSLIQQHLTENRTFMGKAGYVTCIANNQELAKTT